MTFLAPWFLIGTLAAAIPLLLHLRRSRRVRKIVFSHTRFFDEAFLRASRRAKIQDLLLMVMRMMLLALLAMALAQPLLRGGTLGGVLGNGSARDVVLVLDDSASMGVIEAAGSRIEQARIKALAVLDELSPTRGDRAALVLAGWRATGPQTPFDELTDDLQAVREAIRAVEVTDLAGDLNGAVAQAAKLLGAEVDDRGRIRPTTTRGGVREIYVLSDLRHSAVATDFVQTAGPTIQTFFVNTRHDERSATDNVSVDAIQYGSPRPMLGVPFAFRAMLTNHGGQPRQQRVNLVVNGGVVASRSVELPPGRSVMVRFVHRFTEPGWFGGRVELDAAEDDGDALPADDRRHFALHVQQRLRILAVNGAPSSIARNDELFFLRLALNVAVGDGDRGLSLQWSEITLEQVNESTLAGHPLVILANVGQLDAAALAAVERYVDAGGSVLWTAGDRVDPSALSTWIGPGRLHGGLLPGRLIDVPTSDALAALRGEAAQAQRITFLDDTHPALAGLGDGTLGGFAPVQVQRRLAWRDLSPDAAVLMEVAGEPLLVERRYGRGRVVGLATTIDRDWTDLPLQPVYLPWVHRLVSHLATPGGERHPFLLTGDAVPMPASVTDARPMQIERPDGSVTYPEPIDAWADGQRYLTHTDQAGLYRVRPVGEAPAQITLLLAANLDRVESIPTYLDAEQIAARVDADAAWAYVGTDESVTAVANLARRGYGLWDLLLFAALAVAVVEPWVANHLSKRRRARAAGLTPTIAAPPMEEPQSVKAA